MLSHLSAPSWQTEASPHRDTSGLGNLGFVRPTTIYHVYDKRCRQQQDNPTSLYTRRSFLIVVPSTSCSRRRYSDGRHSLYHREQHFALEIQRQCRRSSSVQTVRRCPLQCTSATLPVEFLNSSLRIPMVIGCQCPPIRQFYRTRRTHRPSPGTAESVVTSLTATLTVVVDNALCRCLG